MQRHIAAGILALAFGAASALAQNAQAPPAQQAPEKPAPKPPEKPKKVWTNDDLTDLRSSVQITTAAATPTSEGAAAEEDQGTAAAPGKEKPLPPEKDPQYYKSKLVPLRKQRDDLDAKIKEIQGAINNPYEGTNKITLGQQAPSAPSQGPQPSTRPDDSLYGNQVVKPKDQLALYQKQRDDVQQQIDDLESQARRNGIDPGDIQ